MNYKLHYDRLIERAKHRSILPNFYYEIHHIIPRCLGGNNKKENLVKLFPEEHYVAHQFLVKLYPNEVGLKYALHIMTVENLYQQRSCNKEYAWVRKQYSEACKGRKLSSEHREKIGKSLKGKRKNKSYEEQYGKEKAEELRKIKSEQLTGRKKSAEAEAKRIEARKGFKHSDETKILMSESAKKRSPVTNETRYNISKSLSGRKLSEEHVKKIKETKLRNKLKEKNDY